METTIEEKREKTLKLRSDLAKTVEEYFQDRKFTVTNTLAYIILDGNYHEEEVKDLADVICFIEDIRTRANTIEKIEKGEWNS